MTYEVENRTPHAWPALVLEFDLKTVCDGREQSITERANGPLGISGDRAAPFVKNYEHLVISLLGKVAGCSGRVSGVKLVVAENDKFRIDGVTGERIDFAKQAAAEAAARRRTEAAARARAAKERAEREQKAAAERAVLRDKCSAVYAATIRKLVVDLTVEESRQIRACEALNMYRPK